MMSPSLPNWKIEVVGDDIAWLRVYHITNSKLIKILI